MAFHMWNGESFHIHQLKNQFRRSLYKEETGKKKRNRKEQNKHIVNISAKMEEPKNLKQKKAIIQQELYSLSWPPSLSMAWTKQRWSSGVHLKRGTFDLTYCLTAPLLPQLPIFKIQRGIPEDRFFPLLNNVSPTGLSYKTLTFCSFYPLWFVFSKGVVSFFFFSFNLVGSV
jgi:hypothetical protein